MIRRYKSYQDEYERKKQVWRFAAMKLLTLLLLLWGLGAVHAGRLHPTATLRQAPQSRDGKRIRYVGILLLRVQERFSLSI
jgi:hypothetical protein